jgi:hypothetical protein
MGNILKRKKSANCTNSLSDSLLSPNIKENLYYINNKLDILDDKVWCLEEKTRINLDVLNTQIDELFLLLNKK